MAYFTALMWLVQIFLPEMGYCFDLLSWQVRLVRGVLLGSSSCDSPFSVTGEIATG
jgi:hypothetical protein